MTQDPEHPPLPPEVRPGDDERWARLPPEVRRWVLDHVAGVDFRCVRTWRVFHGPKGWPFRVERVDEVPVKVVDIQGRKSA